MFTSVHFRNENPDVFVKTINGSSFEKIILAKINPKELQQNDIDSSSSCFSVFLSIAVVIYINVYISENEF